MLQVFEPARHALGQCVDMQHQIGGWHARRNIVNQEIGDHSLHAQQAIIMRLVGWRNNSAQRIAHAP